MKIAVKKEGGLVLVEVFTEGKEPDFVAEFVDQEEEGHLITEWSWDFGYPGCLRGRTPMNPIFNIEKKHRELVSRPLTLPQS